MLLGVLGPRHERCQMRSSVRQTQLHQLQLPPGVPHEQLRVQMLQLLMPVSLDARHLLNKN